MALSVVLVTEVRLGNLTDEQIANFRDLLPETDWCTTHLGRPTRAQILRYVKDETVDRDTGQTYASGLGAAGVLDESNDPYGLVLYRRLNGVVRVSHWYVPWARTPEAVQRVVTFAGNAGASRIEGVVRNAKVRERMAEFAGVDVNGFTVGYNL